MEFGLPSMRGVRPSHKQPAKADLDYRLDHPPLIFHTAPTHRHERQDVHPIPTGQIREPRLSSLHQARAPRVELNRTNPPSGPTLTRRHSTRSSSLQGTAASTRRSSRSGCGKITSMLTWGISRYVSIQAMTPAATPHPSEIHSHPLSSRRCSYPASRCRHPRLDQTALPGPKRSDGPSRCSPSPWQTSSARRISSSRPHRTTDSTCTHRVACPMRRAQMDCWALTPPSPGATSISSGQQPRWGVWRTASCCYGQWRR